MNCEEAFEYAEKCKTDVNVMLEESTGKYYVVLESAVEHWKQHYRNVAEVRVVSQVKIL